MKKLWLLLVIALCFTLCACPALEEAPPAAKEVHITAGKIEPGMTAKNILVEVTIDGQPVACRVELTGFAWDGYWEMEDDEPVGDPVCVRLNVYYSLPAGYDVDQINVTMECDGGEYDGTGSVSFDKDGNVEAWSHALYGEDPLPPETEPTEQTQPTEVETQPDTQPTEQTQPTTPPETQLQHTHSWTEVPGLGIYNCTIDSVKNYKCSCGESKQESVPAPGHDLREWSVSEATCTRYGSKSTSCKRCGAGFLEEIPATGHNWSEWVKETGRVHKRTCSVCGEEETANHNIPSGSVTCTDCGEDIIN